MKKKQWLLQTSVALALGSTTITASAFNTGDVLTFDPGVGECLLGGTYPDNCVYDIATITSGSYFALDANGNGRVDINEKTPISPGPVGGIIIGNLQPASGSHQGCPDGTENPGPDKPWCFFGNTGMHQTISAPITDNGNGTLDFSGWGATWIGIPNIPLGGDPANFPGDTGLATLTCSSTPCQISDTYTVDYKSHIPRGDVTGFGSVGYFLHLEKTSAIPQPSISLLVVGGSNQECSSVGGSMVTINPDSTIPPGDALGSISWAVNGNAVPDSTSLSHFLPLGSHTVEAMLTTTGGLTATASVNITVRDTTRPELSTGFIDSHTGETITSILHSRVHFVAVDLTVNDICDAEPTSKGALVPLMEVTNGDTIKIFGKKGEVELPTTAIQLTGTASDASRNHTSGQALLTVKPD